MEYKQPLLSVIVPVYNTEKFLEKCLDSIKNQTYKNLEVIVVDDCSTDNSADIINKFIDEDNRFKCVKHDSNKGLFQARITGVENSAGEYFAFVDSDDYISIDWYRMLIKNAVENDSDMVIGNTVCEDENNWMYVRPLSRNVHYTTKTGDDVFSFLTKGEGLDFSIHTVWNKVYKKTLWDKCIGHFKTINTHLIMTEDIAFSTVFYFYAKKLTFENVDAYFYYRHSGASTAMSKSVEKLEKNLSDLKTVFTFIESFLKSQNVYDKYAVNFKNLKDRYFKYWSYSVKTTFEGLDNVSIFTKNKIKKDFFKFFEKENFEETSKVDTFLDSRRTEWNDKYVKLKEAIVDPSIEFVSFDIFDTLLVRPFLNPSDMYLVMQNYFEELTKSEARFKEIRSYSENRARETISTINPYFKDVTIDEIYDSMEKELHISREICDKLKQKELDLEMAFLRPRKAMKEIYELALYENKKIIIISDMYLTKGNIANLLEKNGYTGYTELFVSSKERCLKHSGELFTCAIKKLDIKDTSTVIHIGDNWNSDHIMPLSLGMKSYFIPKTSDILFNKLEDTYTGDSVNELVYNNNSIIDRTDYFYQFNTNCLYALVANYIFDNPFVSFDNETNYNLDAFFIGMLPVGIHLLGLCKWLIEQSELMKIDTIHFLARDGYLPKYIYDILLKYYPNAAKSNYLYASRKSLLPMSINCELDLYNIKNNIVFTQHSPESLLEMLKNISKPLTDADKKAYKENGIRLSCKFMNNNEYKVFIDKYIEISFSKELLEKEQSICKKYFGENIKENDVTFDLGYSGKIQSYISKACQRPVDVFFVHSNGFGASQIKARDGFKIHSYLDYATSMSGIINEFVLSDFRPSCIGYTMENDEVLPVFEEAGYLFIDEYILDQIKFGAETFVKEFMDTFKDYLYLFDFTSSQTSLPYETFLIAKKWKDREIFACSYVEDTFYAGVKEKSLSDFWWEQISNKNLLNENKGMVVYNNIPSVMSDIYADGLFVSFYNKMNRILPKGSKKRENVKKIARKFIK